MTLRIDPDGAMLVCDARGVAGALGRLLIVSFQTSRDGSWDRLKACPNCKCRSYYRRRRARA